MVIQAINNSVWTLGSGLERIGLCEWNVIRV